MFNIIQKNKQKDKSKGSSLYIVKKLLRMTKMPIQKAENENTHSLDLHDQ